MEDLKRTYVQQIMDYIHENGFVTMRQVQVDLGICSSYARMHDLRKLLDKTDDYYLASINVKRKGKSPYKKYYIKSIVEDEFTETPEDWYEMLGGLPNYEER